MKIVCLLGSPRLTGNSTTVANRFLETAQERGAVTETFALNRLNYRGCQACEACKTKLDKCALDDDLTPALAAVAGADILVLASPVYFGDISSQMKAFVDRTLSYLKPDFLTNPEPSRLAPGKRLVFILSQTQADNMFVDIFPKYEFFYQMMGFRDNRLIRACGVTRIGDVDRRSDIFDLAEKSAIEMVV